ncbi:MAG: hypothetical protein VX589_02560 [Myxococcota bacterium]|nr:hypothetical protein [Myxococcota bacterium]
MRPTLRRFARYAALVLGVLAVVQAVKMAGALNHDVQVIYRAPSGPLAVEVSLSTGDFVRRTEFDADGRAHTLTLPSGDYLFRLEPQGRPARTHAVTVVDDVRLVLDYSI